MNVDAIDDINELADIIIGMLEANKYKIVSKFTVDSAVCIECKGFSLDAYTYSFLKAATIWLFIKPSKKDKYVDLIRQLELIGFKVYTADARIAKANGVPIVREVYSDLAGNSLHAATFVDELIS